MSAPAIIPIDAAMRDGALLGAALGGHVTWATWFAVLRAAFGLPLDHQQRRLFARVSGGRRPPTRRVDELWAVAGRRSGKSRIAAGVSSYIGTFIDHRPHLAKGETGYILSISPSRQQAGLVLSYAKSFIEESPILRPKLLDVTAEELRLADGITIATHSSSYRNVRGRTLLAVVLDEAAFFRDESSANPDVEIVRAVAPALAASGGMLIGISSPYRKVGLLHQRHRDHFGRNDPHVLVVQGATALFNGTIDNRLIERAAKDDPAAAASEWGGEFRADLQAFLDDASVDAAVDHSRPLELPLRPGLSYVAFADASAGRHDAFTFCIGHREGDSFVADVVRGRRPPFDPQSVAGEYARLARQYRVSVVFGDNFSGEWVASAFRKAGVEYRRSALPKSALYLESLPFFMRQVVSIPNHPVLLRELRLLERRVRAGGKDVVDHPQGATDDHANALAGAIWRALGRHAALPQTIVAPRFIAGPLASGVDGARGLIDPNESPNWIMR